MTKIVAMYCIAPTILGLTAILILSRLGPAIQALHDAVAFSY